MGLEIQSYYFQLCFFYPKQQKYNNQLDIQYYWYYIPS